MYTVKTDQITETVAPAVEPISLSEAKAHLRVDIATDDTLISSLITAARQYAETHCGRSFAEHTYRADIPNFNDAITLPGRPIQSISSIKYYNTDSPEALTTVAANVYQLYGACIVRRYGMVWPTSWAYRPDAVQITFVAAYDSPASPTTVAGVPKAVTQALLLIIGDLYENREGQFATGFVQIQPNRTVDMLLHPYRVYL